MIFYTNIANSDASMWTWTPLPISVVLNVEDYDVDVRNIRNGVVDIRNNVVVKCCK